ncbi:hypothetical protein HME9302_00384 [Alteripontixanthobacter maritimus]|uniref:Uncharacterized protein n=1 Tax=Alteripontixanthobacter maritimus TaxID=2161824 RepID=A0A369Q8E7_9SPHN|nr:DUF1465 family protein [Alteripontixanthobacter maritimus]RDC59199.1 hypothetical protein HME9302_00384 [Alteripontixanthobacter maritimus]
MANPANISGSIIETLYCEALVLADEVRTTFDLQPIESAGPCGDPLRAALSEEGLRTTTRMMHVLAWLLNHRAYFAGEMTEAQLQRHGKLPHDRMSDAANLARFDKSIQRLIEDTHRLHARAMRIDEGWRREFSLHTAEIHQLRERLGRALANARQSG